MIRVVSWNIATMHQPWRDLVEMDADVALLQEVGTIPEDVRHRVELSPHEPWLSHDPTTGYPHYDRWPMVVKLSDRVKVEWFRQVGPVWVAPERPQDMAVSGVGTIDVAWVFPADGTEPFIAASMYARWFGPHPTAEGTWIYPDASAHRIISDLSAFIGYYDRPERHRILAAGDLNVSFQSTNQFDHRAQTVLDRFQALGFDYLGRIASNHMLLNFGYRRSSGRSSHEIGDNWPPSSGRLAAMHRRIRFGYPSFRRPPTY